MKFAFLLNRYRPIGGLESSCLGIARALAARGAEVHLLVGDWRGPRPDGILVQELGRPGVTNAARYAAFGRRAARAVDRNGYDYVVGFNRFAGLDCHYPSGACFRAQSERQPALLRLTRRHRQALSLERAVFDPAASTQVLVESSSAIAGFRACYDTPEDRFHIMPPALTAAFRIGNERVEQRREARAALGLSDQERLVLMVGTSARTKGFDRGIRAVAALPDRLRDRVRLMTVGDPASRLQRLAGRNGIGDRFTAVAARNDLRPLYLAADLLLHPARSELYGYVILEALALGLPVLCSGTCGFAEHVTRAEGGRVLSEPFRQDALDHALAEVLRDAPLDAWSRNALAYTRAADIWRGHEAAADILLGLAGRPAGQEPATRR